MPDPEKRGQAKIEQVERAIFRVGISAAEPEDNWASQSALSIQNPSQAGLRTQGEGSGVEGAAAARSAGAAKAGLVSERASVNGIG